MREYRPLKNITTSTRKIASRRQRRNRTKTRKLNQAALHKGAPRNRNHASDVGNVISLENVQRTTRIAANVVRKDTSLKCVRLKIVRLKC